MAAVIDREPGVTVREVAPEERWQLLDEAARYDLAMSGMAPRWHRNVSAGTTGALQASVGC